MLGQPQTVGGQAGARCRRRQRVAYRALAETLCGSVCSSRRGRPYQRQRLADALLAAHRDLLHERAPHLQHLLCKYNQISAVDKTSSQVCPRLAPHVSGRVGANFVQTVSRAIDVHDGDAVHIEQLVRKVKSHKQPGLLQHVLMNRLRPPASAAA